MVYTSVASIPISQIFHSSLRVTNALKVQGTQAAVPRAIRQATAELLGILQTLCAPTSGWPTDQPKTAKTLLPYVGDEVADLVAALHSQLVAVPSAAQSVSHDGDPSIAPMLFSELRDRFLWAIAASSPTAMNLLEGMAVSVLTAPENEGVRLLPVFTLHLDGSDYALDLIAQTAFESERVLADDELVELPAGSDRPITVAQWRELLWQQAIAHDPEFAQWCVGLPIQILVPGQRWIRAQAALDLYLIGTGIHSTLPIVEDGNAFLAKTETTLLDLGMPSSRVWVARPPVIAELDSPVIEPADLEPTEPVPLAATVCLAENDLLQRAIADWQVSVLSRQLLGQGCPNAPALDAEAVISKVFGAINSSPSHRPEMAFLRSPLSLAQLCTQLQWLWVRASEDLMPLLGGIPTYRLRPGKSWEAGTLTATGQLRVTVGSRPSAYLDIVNAQWHVLPPTLQPDDILHLQAVTPLPKSLWQTATLQPYLTAQLQQRSPILSPLMTGLSANITLPSLATAATTECPATLHLQVALTFYQLE